MGEHGTGHGEKSIWGRTAASSHAQRFPPCQAYPLRVSPLWIHGHLHHQGHDAGLDRLVASPPSYPAVLSACQCRPWKQGLLGAAGGQGPGVVDWVCSFGSDHGSQPSLPERGLVVQSFSSLGYTRCVWQMANGNGSAARVWVTTMRWWAIRLDEAVVNCYRYTHHCSEPDHPTVTAGPGSELTFAGVRSTSVALTSSAIGLSVVSGTTTRSHSFGGGPQHRSGWTLVMWGCKFPPSCVRPRHTLHNLD